LHAGTNQNPDPTRSRIQGLVRPIHVAIAKRDVGHVGVPDPSDTEPQALHMEKGLKNWLIVAKERATIGGKSARCRGCQVLTCDAGPSRSYSIRHRLPKR
jgi:hypothetical protein